MYGDSDILNPGRDYFLNIASRVSARDSTQPPGRARDAMTNSGFGLDAGERDE